MTNIRLLIADDHQIVRAGISFLLMTHDSIEIVGETRNGVEAVEMALALRPDVVLLDLMMPKMTGIDAIRAIMSKWSDAQILVLTSFTDDASVFTAIKAGALGYLLKDSAPEALVSAIHSVACGESSLHPKIARRLLQELNRPSKLPLTESPLTEREMDVLKLVAHGLPNQEIADRTFVTERTVRAHVSSILNKLHLANRTQVALYALRKGIVPLNPTATFLENSL